jgi:site-specific DNA recombinase
MDNTKTAIYTCYSRSKKMAKMIKDPNCKNKNYPVEELENIIFSEIRKLDNTDTIERIRNNKNKENESDKKIALIKGEIKELSNQISKLMDLYSISGITIEDVDKKIEPLAIKRTKLVKELDTLTSEEAEGLANEEILELVKEFEDALKKNNLERVRTAISILIKRIDIDEDDVIIHWNFS